MVSPSVSLGGTPRNTDRVSVDVRSVSLPRDSLEHLSPGEKKPRAEPNLLPAIFSPVVIKGLLAQGKRPKNAGGWQKSAELGEMPCGCKLKF